MTPQEVRRRYESALGDRDAPLALVDLDALRTNASRLVEQADGLPIRVASKSVRCLDLLRRVLAMPGFSGVLAYTPAEALHLAESGIHDVLVAYPSTDRSALAAIARRVAEGAPGRVVLMVDSTENAEPVSRVARAAGVRLPIALDLDAGWRPRRGVGVGALRSPVHSPAQAAVTAASLVADRCLELVGVMAYEGQIAGVGDDVPGKPLRSKAIQAMQSASLRDLRERLPRVLEAVRREVRSAGGELQIVNGGGTGSLARTAAVGVVNELAAGSGLYAPTLFDTYRSLDLLPAALFALPVVRRPGPGVVTVLGGGYIASGATGRDRSPTPVLPTGLRLTSTEGAGEVQTPRRGDAADRLAIGDRVYFRHAKAGELCERFPTLLLVEGDEVVDEVPTYRGEGLSFG